MTESLKVYVGFDPREALAYAVCVASLLRHATIPLDVRPLVQADLRGKGLYRRPEALRDGQRWCEISDAPCSTEFSNSRFAVPLLAAGEWALFCDSDMLWRADVSRLLPYTQPDLAALCVQHDHEPVETTKMRGQEQTKYSRKNWSSLVLWNGAHESNALLAGVLNTWPGRALHALRWLRDEEIGALPAVWNWLEGVDPLVLSGGPLVVHYTRGTPDMPGRGDAAFTSEWWGYVEELGLRPLAG